MFLPKPRLFLWERHRSQTVWFKAKCASPRHRWLVGARGRGTEQRLCCRWVKTPRSRPQKTPGISYWASFPNSLCFSQLKAARHSSHHKTICPMDRGWSVFMQNVNSEPPPTNPRHKKRMLWTHMNWSLFLNWCYPSAPCTTAYIIFTKPKSPMSTC